MKQVKFLHKPLYVFVILGLLLWLCAYTVTPAKPTHSLSRYTIIYILASLVCYFIGYFISRKVYRVKYCSNPKAEYKKTIIWALLVIIYLSWIIRYIDVFYDRGISFSNTIQENRDLFGLARFRIIYIFGAVFKELYFLPLLLTLLKFRKDNKLLILSCLLYVFPLIIPFLRGTRKDLFLVFLFLLMVLIIARVIIINAKTLIKIGFVFIVLNALFYNILMSRETPESNTRSVQIDKIIDTATYNDLLQPTGSYKDLVKSSNGLKKGVLFNYLHSLQYYCHGIFELDFLVKDKIKNGDYLYGEYNFHLFPKTLDKLNIIDYNSDKIHFILPRRSTYITFLGALFVDFGWLGVLMMFFMGFSQNIIDKKVVDGSVLFLGLYVFFILFNIFLPVINLIKGTGTYLVFASVTIIILNKFKNEAKLS